MRILSWICLALISVQVAHSSTVPANITKSVVFIYRDAVGTPSQADGTGFFVSVPVPGSPSRSWLYLVTAKHVLHTDANNPNSPIYPRLFARMNLRSGGSAMKAIDILLSGPTQDVFFHSDSSVDVAVIAVSIPDPENYEVALLPEDLLMQEKDFQSAGIGVGSDMFFTGMFTPYLGEKKSYPIVRFGKLAMIPEEKIDFGGAKIKAYLVETFTFGGNSGSPVFFYLSSDNTPGRMIIGPPVLRVAGLMKGFFGDIEPVLMAQTTNAPGQLIPVIKSNSGIAVVVPAQQISEILHSSDLEARRNATP